MVKVYFDYGTFTDLMAVFMDEETYDLCRSILETEANSVGAKLVESIVTLKLDETMEEEEWYKFEEDCICFHPKGNLYPGIDFSDIIYRSKENIVRIILSDNETELVNLKSLYQEDGSHRNYFKLISNDPKSFVAPELIKKGMKFKTLSV